MLSESLVVVEIAEDQQSAQVRGSRQAACGSCSAKLGCGYGMLKDRGSSYTFKLPTKALSEGVVAGDLIRLALPANELLMLAFQAYAQPLLFAMVLVTAVSLVMPEQTGVQFVALLIGLALGAKLSMTGSSRQKLAERLEISKDSHRN